MAHHAAGAVAHANEEAVRAWDTVLYERWKKNRKVFVGARTASRRSYSAFPATLREGDASTSAAGSGRRLSG
jgi:hypothetical protein